MVTVHPSVTSEPIAQGRHSPFLGDVTVGRPCPRRSPQQRCGPSTCVWAYHNATSPSLISCPVLGIGVSCRSLRSWLCLRSPIRFLWLWYTSRGIYGKRVCFITSRASLGGYRTESHRLSPHFSTAGQPSGLPWFLPRGVKGSTWLSHGDFLPSFSPRQRAQG